MRKVAWNHLVALAIGVAASLQAVAQGPASHEGSLLPLSGVDLEIHSDDAEYSLGHPVRLVAALEVNSQTPVQVRTSLNPLDGFIQVYIADGPSAYLEYRAPRWGLRDGIRSPLVVSSGKGEDMELKIFYNDAPSVAHLSAEHASEVRQESILSTLAFPHAGRYRIRVVLWDFDFALSVESNEIEVVVENPGPGDITAWEILSSDPALLYFIHEGSPMGPPWSPKSQEVVDSLGGIVQGFPTCSYASEIRASLEAYTSLIRELSIHAVPR